jgi:hypothetical protein
MSILSTCAPNESCQHCLLCVKSVQLCYVLLACFWVCRSQGYAAEQQHDSYSDDDNDDDDYYREDDYSDDGHDSEEGVCNCLMCEQVGSKHILSPPDACTPLQKDNPRPLLFA